MTKHITITIGEHTFEKCIAHFHGNRSRYIEGLIDKGFDAENDIIDSLRAHNTKMKQEIFEKNDEIKKLQAENGRLKKYTTKNYTFDDIKKMRDTQQEFMDKMGVEGLEQEEIDRLKFEFNKIQVEIEKINPILVDVWKREEEEARRKRLNFGKAFRDQGMLRELVKE